MKCKRVIFLLGVMLAAAGSLTVAQANSLVNITVTSLPDLDTSLGTPVSSQPIAEKSTSQGDAQIFAWLQSQVPGGDPAAVNHVALSGGSTSVGNLSSYIGDYLVVHWGNGQAGAKFFNPNPHGGFDQAFFITGADLNSITLTTPSFTGNVQQGKNVTSQTLDVGGLSFWRVYGSATIPDGGTTVLLLGTALSALGLLRRKMV